MSIYHDTTIEIRGLGKVNVEFRYLDEDIEIESATVEFDRSGVTVHLTDPPTRTAWRKIVHEPIPKAFFPGIVNEFWSELLNVVQQDHEAEAESYSEAAE